MQTRPARFGVAQRKPLSALAVLAALVMVLCATRTVGLCIVFRLTRRAVPGCVPAWSADRAPPVPVARV
ncbi:hypothetical protein CA850_14505 [Micromonospora echinospora]|uniref:Uncharacterized protein n=1 Tax=Micromonospora echinospora TaxID=1877 RepID=A0A1C4Z9H1_MICEC|nr:hypothetical protein [Micromonospora echinospora]OZV80556.1 hypothetical protein CA850_14505 [Micromonospora echinospora]SCF29633.1 hypothetical protein GA0070618_4953 [Micromonospora echinospora]